MLELGLQRLYQLPDVRIDLSKLAIKQIDEVQGALNDPAMVVGELPGQGSLQLRELAAHFAQRHGGQLFRIAFARN